MKWHQDIQFWPHTNYDLLTIGVFLEDVEPGMGEVGFVPDSHDGPLYDLYDGDLWVGALCDDDVARAGVEAAEYPVGPAGTITVHNCRTVHGGTPNARPCAPCCSRPTRPPTRSVHRPRPPVAPRRRGDPRRARTLGAPRPPPVPLPPSGPYKPIFVSQQRED